MNWDAIGAVGEVVGAIGVIVSLLYLASQVRHSAKTTGDSTARDLFTTTAVYIATMAERDNREIVMKGLTEYQNLTGAEKFTFDSLLAGFLNIVECSFISTRDDLFTTEAVELCSDYLKLRFFPYQGFKDWWGESKGLYINGMRDWIDNEISHADPNSDFWKIK